MFLNRPFSLLKVHRRFSRDRVFCLQSEDKKASVITESVFYYPLPHILALPTVFLQVVSFKEIGNVNKEDTLLSRQNQVTFLTFLTMKPYGIMIFSKAKLFKPFLSYTFLLLS